MSNENNLVKIQNELKVPKTNVNAFGKYKYRSAEDILEALKKHVILSPHQYRVNAETELNEMRELSGVEPHKIYKEQDSQLKSFIALAGL